MHKNLKKERKTNRQTNMKNKIRNARSTWNEIEWAIHSVLLIAEPIYLLPQWSRPANQIHAEMEGNAQPWKERTIHATVKALVIKVVTVKLGMSWRLSFQNYSAIKFPGGFSF